FFELFLPALAGAFFAGAGAIAQPEVILPPSRVSMKGLAAKSLASAPSNLMTAPGSNLHRGEVSGAVSVISAVPEELMPTSTALGLTDGLADTTVPCSSGMPLPFISPQNFWPSAPVKFSLIANQVARSGFVFLSSSSF